MMENNGAPFVQRWETYQKQNPIERSPRRHKTPPGTRTGTRRQHQDKVCRKDSDQNRGFDRKKAAEIASLRLFERRRLSGKAAYS